MTDGPVRSRSRRARWRLALALGLLPPSVAACASGGPASAPTMDVVTVLPTRTVFDGGDFTNQPSSVRDTVLDEPRERIWSALPQVFRTLGVEASTLDSRSYAIGNTGWRPSAIHGTRLSSFLQCGAGVGGPNADTYEVTMQLLVQLEAPAASATLVRLVLDAYARPRDRGGPAVHCSSFGTLEGRVVRLIGDALTGAGEGGYPLLSAGAGASSTGALPTARALGRLPSPDDVIRVGCAPSDLREALYGEGLFRGARDATLLLEVDPSGGTVQVPMANVRSIAIQEERSRARMGALMGALIGAAAGAYSGYTLHDPDARYHFPPTGTAAIGGVLGAIAGAALGAIGGSLFDRHVWVDATPAWQARFGAAAAAPAGPTTAAGACPGFAPSS